MWVPSRWALSVFQIVLLGWAAARIVVRWRNGRGVGMNPIELALAGIVVWAALQAGLGITVDLFRTQEEILHWTVVVCGFAIAREQAADPRWRERFLTYIVIFATMLSVLAMITVFASPPGVIAWTWDTGTGCADAGSFRLSQSMGGFRRGDPADLPGADFYAAEPCVGHIRWRRDFWWQAW
ncbi:MAG: hypothetical protein WDO18_06070 [Acidobacteriota bacterium]